MLECKFSPTFKGYFYSRETSEKKRMREAACCYLNITLNHLNLALKLLRYISSHLL